MAARKTVTKRNGLKRSRFDPSVVGLLVESGATMIRWLLLSLFIYVGTNWFLLPTFPAVPLAPLTVWSSLGIGGMLMVGILLLGRKLGLDPGMWRAVECLPYPSTTTANH